MIYKSVNPRSNPPQPMNPYVFVMNTIYPSNTPYHPMLMPTTSPAKCRILNPAYGRILADQTKAWIPIFLISMLSWKHEKFKTKQTRSRRSRLQRFYCSPPPCGSFWLKAKLPGWPVVKVLFQSKYTRFSIQMDGPHPNKFTIFQALTKGMVHPY